MDTGWLLRIAWELISFVLKRKKHYQNQFYSYAGQRFVDVEKVRLHSSYLWSDCDVTCCLETRTIKSGWIFRRLPLWESLWHNSVQKIEILQSTKTIIKNAWKHPIERTKEGMAREFFKITAVNLSYLAVIWILDILVLAYLKMEFHAC